MAWGQYLVVKGEGVNEGGIVGPRAKLSELLDDCWCRHLIMASSMMIGTPRTSRLRHEQQCCSPAVYDAVSGDSLEFTFRGPAGS